MTLPRDEQKRIAKYESNLKEEETRLLEDTFIKQRPWILYVFAVSSALILEVSSLHTLYLNGLGREIKSKYLDKNGLI